MSSEFRVAAVAVKPVTLQQYLRNRGWAFREEAHGFALYERGEVVLDVPLREEMARYDRRMTEVLGLLAAVEERSPFALVEDLLRSPGDALAFRVASEQTRRGSIPLGQSLVLRQAASNLLLASAHSELRPLSYFPRMSKTRAKTLLSTVRETVPRHGSFVAGFVVPTTPSIGEQAEIDEDPFGRRVVKRLMLALGAVARVRSVGDLEPLLSMADRGVSGNLLAALHSMADVLGEGTLDLSVSWATNRAMPTVLPRRVTFPAEAIEGLDGVAARMKATAKTVGFEMEGNVLRLERDTTEGPGAIVLRPTSEDADMTRVKIRLDAKAYEEAIEAHRLGDVVRVVGTLEKQGRRWTLTEATGFERLGEPDPDE